MKRILPVFLCLLLLTTGCAGGNADNVTIIAGDSVLFSQEEILEAMDIAIGHFEAEFEGCTLLTMEYDKEHSAKYAAEWAETYDAEEGIILLSSFEVDENGGDGSFNPGDTYHNWQWVLVRLDEGAWELKTWGYG